MSLTSKINNTLSVLVILADAEWAVIEVQNMGGKFPFLHFWKVCTLLQSMT
jgi:hypothetical protein